MRTLLACFLLSCPLLHAAEDLRVFVEKHCVECHDADTKKGGLQIDTLAVRFDEPEAFQHWSEIYERVAAHEMPPRKQKTQPADAERTAFMNALRMGLLEVEKQQREADGRVVLRRLNCVEYENSLNDLFGTEADLKGLLPEDASADGFDNNSSALSMSTVLLERYLDAADAALDAALVKGPKPERQKWHVSLLPKDLKPGDFRTRGGSRFLPDETVVLFNSGPYQPLHLDQFHAPIAGLYRVRVKQSVYQGKNKPLTIAWYGGAVNSRTSEPDLIGLFDVPAGEPSVTEFTVKLPARGSLKPKPYRLGNRDLKDASTYEGPGVAVHWVEVEGPIIDAWPPRGRTLIAGAGELEDGTLADAEQALFNVASGLFRRPVERVELARYSKLVSEALEAKKPYREAVRAGLRALLCAPDFLFLREVPGTLDDFALASRLSYFLWSSLPDEALMKSARAGRLKTELHEQVERMIRDPKSQRFVENFTGQWLGLRNINATTPEKKQHPDWDDALQDAMVTETHLFFTELLTHDLGVRNFIHSDFSMMNQRLAELYRIPDVKGWEFRKVMLPPDAHRGGVLGQGAIMKITANGNTTSPVVRGNWVLKNLLGKPPKPPPPNVPALEPDVRGAATVRELVAKHRASTACASCHDRMDPLGLALESYDIIGEWRTNYKVAKMTMNKKTGEPSFGGYKPGAAVDSSGTLPDGSSFTGIDELKKLLLADTDQVARCIAGKLITYATGASLTFTDKMIIEDIVQQTRSKDHGLRTLIHAVIASPAFQNK